MKKLFLTIVFVFFLRVIFADPGCDVQYNEPREGVYELTFEIGDFQLKKTTLDALTFTKILFESGVTTKLKGYAELPFVHASVMIDPVKNVNIVITPGEYEDFVLENPCVPSRGVIYRDTDPATVPYVIDPNSITDKWYPANIVEQTAPFILKDIRGTNVYVYPFQYNAKDQILRVYKTIKVELIENNTTPVNPMPYEVNTVLREMDAIYRSIFINYGIDGSRYDLTVGQYGDILVVTTARDEAAIQPYIDWKTEKGYNIQLEVVAPGTIVNSMVQTAYDNNNDLLYVQLVGDWNDIKCNTLGSSPMDPQVGCVVGGDDYADICVGRISAESPADVTVQVDKFINYEKNPQAGAAWYATATGIASNQGPGDDNEIDYAHNDTIFSNKLDPFSFDTYNPIYDPGASTPDVFAAVNNGTSVINYTGHGSPQSWGTSGFSNSNVASLTNGAMLPWIVSVACNNGDFHTGTCFSESWLRQSNGGAVAMMGASIGQPWDPPMRGQDYFMDMIIGGYDYAAHSTQNGISSTEGRTTLGAAIFNGLTMMTTESGTNSDWETAKTWNLFGDPSLQVRTAAPEALTLTSNLVMAGIPFTTTVTTANGPVEGAMVALSQDGMMFSGVTDISGSVTINQTLDQGTALLVVTAFNTETIYEDVIVVPPDGPYVLFDTLEINDMNGNNNGLLDYGETVFLTVTLTNVGNDDAIDVTAVISSADLYVTVIDSTADFGLIPANSSVTVQDAFEIEAADSIPDNHSVFFTLDATGSGDDIWSSGFVIQAQAPVLEYVSFEIDDSSSGNGNGRLDPGETADLIIDVCNTGSSEAYNVTGGLSTTSSFITINTASQNMGNLMGGDTTSQAYNITVDEATPAGHLTEFMIDITADLNIGTQGEFSAVVGQIPVLVVDLDGNNNSAPSILTCLENLSVGSENYDAFPENLDLFTSVFVCLGIYSDNHILTGAEGQKLADYLNNGGNLYMEGGDTWYYDQQYTPTPVHPMFSINALADGADDLSSILGEAGSIVEDMTFTYSGDNSYIDHIEPEGNASLMFKNMNPEYGCVVSYDEGEYKTIGSSFEFGGLDDFDYTKDDYMIAILDFFGIEGVWTDVDEAVTAEILTVSYPNPFSAVTSIHFQLQERSRTVIEIFNINGQKVITLSDMERDAGNYEVKWNGTNESGHKVADGIYFYHLRAGGQVVSGKIIKM